MKTDKKTLKLGLFGATGTVIIEDGFVTYRWPYGQVFKVRLTDLRSVNVEHEKLGKATLRLIGDGNIVLGDTKLTAKDAEKVRDWITENIK